MTNAKPLKVSEGGGFGFEGGDGFDEAGDGEGVADAAVAADQAEDAAFAGKLDRDAHERGDAGAVDLRDAVQDDDNFLRATFDDGFESVVELLGRLADGEPAVYFKYRYSTGFADVNFHRQPVSHGDASIYPGWVGMAIRHAAPHYTLEGKLHKANRSKSLQAESFGSRGCEASEKRMRKIKISNWDRRRACV